MMNTQHAEPAHAATTIQALLDEKTALESQYAELRVKMSVAEQNRDQARINRSKADNSYRAPISMPERSMKMDGSVCIGIQVGDSRRSASPPSSSNSRSSSRASQKSHRSAGPESSLHRAGRPLRNAIGEVGNQQDTGDKVTARMSDHCQALARAEEAARLAEDSYQAAKNAYSKLAIARNEIEVKLSQIERELADKQSASTAMLPTEPAEVRRDDVCFKFVRRAI